MRSNFGERRNSARYLDSASIEFSIPTRTKSTNGTKIGINSLGEISPDWTVAVVTIKNETYVEMKMTIDASRTNSGFDLALILTRNNACKETSRTTGSKNEMSVEKGD